MSQEMWLTLVSIAVGTYLIRLLPYLWMRKKLAKHETWSPLVQDHGC